MVKDSEADAIAAETREALKTASTVAELQAALEGLMERAHAATKRGAVGAGTDTAKTLNFLKNRSLHIFREGAGPGTPVLEHEVRVALQNMLARTTRTQAELAASLSELEVLLGAFSR